ncbi:hypothetical protein J6590_070571 [Homalodisca vitripennis]|nr:hypothetical protein J6590_070571 [Homalodisca vitripennis]
MRSEVMLRRSLHLLPRRGVEIIQILHLSSLRGFVDLPSLGYPQFAALSPRQPCRLTLVPRWIDATSAARCGHAQSQFPRTADKDTSRNWQRWRRDSLVAWVGGKVIPYYEGSQQTVFRETFRQLSQHPNPQMIRIARFCNLNTLSSKELAVVLQNTMP